MTSPLTPKEIGEAFHRPHRYASSGKRLAKKICILITLALLAYAVWMVLIREARQAQASPERQQIVYDSQRLFTEETKRDIIRKLLHHKPEPLPLVPVEVTPAGYRYQWEGKWVVLK